MRQTWRWFGPKDPISLTDLPMAGVEGVVSALHDLPPGAPWPRDQIAARRAVIEAAGLTWDVVESVPVSEAIKTQGPDFAAHVAAYKSSLEAIAAEGIEVVCYNFMPVLDWTRTALAWRQPHGGTAMLFDLLEFAVFDVHLLERAGAEADYPADILSMARARFAQMDKAARLQLTQNVIAGLPGANEGWDLDAMRAQLAQYSGIDARHLRQNLHDFLSEIVPLAEMLGLRLCCHPDDPPFPLLGLPRVVSRQTDYADLVAAVPSPANGITFCTGSLGVDPAFDPVAFVQALGPHIHFVHLRNTTRLGPAGGGRSSFFEAPHLDGDTDMVATIRALLAEQTRRRNVGRADSILPMRPDHGQALLDDLNRPSQPGYPLIGRMRGLAELRGVMRALG